MPGLFVDRYADAVVLQTTCGGADALEPLWIDCLIRLLSPKHLVVRNDAATRRREELRQHVTQVVGQGPVTAIHHEGRIAYEVDLLTDQKTGSFLDQTENHVRAAIYAGKTALDCFTYHGGFALQLAAGGASVRGYDISPQAVSRATANAARAGLTERASFQQADVFELLPALLQAGERFDTIICDPPAFASGKETVAKAMAAYKEINLRAMKLLRPNGILITCSCSGRVAGDVRRHVARGCLRCPSCRASGQESPSRSGSSGARGRPGDGLPQMSGVAGCIDTASCDVGIEHASQVTRHRGEHGLEQLRPVAHQVEKVLPLDVQHVQR